MADDQGFQAVRKAQVATITNEIGVYALCDLDEVPIYVGQSSDSIQNRVRRHLTSARSDIIANRLVDVWEIAYVWAWPCDTDNRRQLEARLFHDFHEQSPLMNGTTPADPGPLPFPIPPKQSVRIMTEDDIRTRLEPELRLPRQIEHFSRLVDHILNVKNDKRLRRSLVAHYQRLSRYYERFLGPEVGNVVGPTIDSEES